MYACDYACIYSLACVNVCGHMSIQMDLSAHVHGHSPRKYVHPVDKWVYMGMCVYVQDSVSMRTHLYVIWSAHVSAHGHVSVVPVVGGAVSPVEYFTYRWVLGVALQLYNSVMLSYNRKHNNIVMTLMFVQEKLPRCKKKYNRNHYLFIYLNSFHFFHVGGSACLCVCAPHGLELESWVLVGHQVGTGNPIQVLCKGNMWSYCWVISPAPWRRLLKKNLKMPFTFYYDWVSTAVPVVGQNTAVGQFSPSSMGSRDKTQIIRPGSKHLYLLSVLAGPKIYLQCMAQW